MLSALRELAAGLPVPAVLTVAAVLLVIESGTLAGMALPGTTLLVALGLWAHAVPHALLPAVAVAAAASVAGAHLSWWRGRTAPGGSVPRRLAGVRRASVRWLAERGPLATAALLACGHWAAAARPTLPRLAGAADVPYRIAGPVLSVSGTAWATTLVLLGHHVGPHVVTHAGWAPVVIVLFLLAALTVRKENTLIQHSSALHAHPGTSVRDSHSARPPARTRRR